MDVSSQTTHWVRNFIAIALSLLLGQTIFAQSTENQQMVFEGSLTDASGNPISLAGEQLDFYISANGCYLYGETSSISGDSQGNILHRFGSSPLVAGSPNSFAQSLFFGTASGTTTFAGNDCTVTAADTRLAQVYYPAQNITATIELGTVPYSHNAQMLNGKIAADFIEVSNDTNTLFYSGTSGQFLSKSAAGALTWESSNVTSDSITSALGYTPASSTALADYTATANNLSDLASATVARANLDLGSLATKSSVTLSSDVSGTLPIANGGSQWSNHANGLYVVSNTTIGSNAVGTSTKLYVESNSSGQVAKFNNLSTSGYGLRVDVAGTNSSQYALNINNGTGSIFMVQNDGRIGVGTMAPNALVHIMPGTSSVAPLMLTSGTLQSTPTAGSIEYDGDYLYLTDESNIRRTFATGTNSNSIDNITHINSPSTINLVIGDTAYLTMLNNGNVGIGTPTPTTALTVSGTIKSTAGGFEFPDATTQNTSAFGGYEHIVNTCSTSTCTVNCSTGKKLLSGGCGNSGVALKSSYPLDHDTWQCEWSGAPTSGQAYAICTQM